MATGKMITVKYAKVGGPIQGHYAEFEEVVEAQLFWDTLWYLRNEYIMQSSRPVEFVGVPQ